MRATLAPGEGSRDIAQQARHVTPNTASMTNLGTGCSSLIARLLRVVQQRGGPVAVGQRVVGPAGQPRQQLLRALQQRNITCRNSMHEAE